MREGGKGIVDVDVDGENLIAIVSALYSGRLSFQSHAHAASLLRDSNKVSNPLLSFPFPGERGGVVWFGS